MKRTIIATLVGAIILFVWQFLAWEVLPIHAHSFKYNAGQDTVMSMLSQHLKDKGVYAMPMPSEGMSSKDREAFMKKYDGKPNAMIFYNDSMTEDMASNMIFGLIIDLIAVLIVVFMMNKAGGNVSGFGGRLMVVMCFPVFVIFINDLMNLNWFHYPWGYVCDNMVDIFLGWLITGLWLAAYNKQKAAEA